MTNNSNRGVECEATARLLEKALAGDSEGIAAVQLAVAGWSAFSDELEPRLHRLAAAAHVLLAASLEGTAAEVGQARSVLVRLLTPVGPPTLTITQGA